MPDGSTLAPLSLSGGPKQATMTSSSRAAPFSFVFDSEESASCEWAGVRYTAHSTHGASMKLARKMLAAGCPDGDWTAYDRHGRLLMFGSSLHSLADWTVTDRKGPPTFERWRPRERGVSSDG